MVRIFYGRISDRLPEKTDAYIKSISSNGGKAVLVVPEQLSIKREFAVNTRKLKNVTVLNFKRLCNEIFRSCGKTARKTADGAMNAAAVYRAVTNVYDKLNYYKKTAFTHGFVMKLITAFSEFEMNCMTLESVLSLPENVKTPDLTAKYTDLFCIYDEYKKLWKDEYKSPGDDITFACELLELNDVFSDTTVVFEGFYGFTPNQIKMLEQIMLCAPDCAFSFTTDLADPLFDTVTGEVNRIEKICKKHDIPVLYERAEKTNRFNSAKLEKFEKHALSDTEKSGKCDDLRIYCASNLTEELEYTACKIKNDVLCDKYRYKDIAIIAPNADSINTLVSTVFEKYGIPVMNSGNSTLMSKPLTAFVINALETAEYGFEFESVFALLKTGLAGMSFDDISLLENYVRLWKIKNRSWGKSDWTQNPLGLSKETSDETLLKRINDLKNHVYVPLSEFHNRLRSSKNCREMLKAIVYLFEDFGVCDNLDKIADTYRESGKLTEYGEYVRVYDAFITMLESIDTVYAEQTLPVSRLCDLISLCALNTKLTTAPSRADEVTFAGMGNVRAEDIKCVYIPCMNDDVIPSPVVDTSLVTETEKRIFTEYGLPSPMDFITTTKREKFNLYTAMFGATDEINMSYSVFTTTGEQKSKSIYLELIEDGGNNEELTRADMPTDFYLVSISSASALAYSDGYSGISEAIYSLTGVRPVPDTDGDAGLTAGIVEALYGKNLRMSFSGINEYANCPFKYFLNRGLRISKTEPVEFKPNDMGTYIHSGLETLLSGDYDITNADGKRIGEYINTISDDYYNEKLADIKGKSKRFDYMFSKARETLNNVAVNVADEIKSSDFRPYGLELKINDFIPPYDIGNGNTLSLSGSIDRVDMTPDGKYAKVIDYKSGKEEFSLKKMSNGIAMQLPIYSSAVKAKYGADIAAMYYLKFGVADVFPDKSFGMDDVEFSEKISSGYGRDGIFRNDAEILRRLDKSGKFTEKIKKDRLADKADFDAISESTEQKIREIGTQIMSGNISVSPLNGGGIDACRYCDYKPICKIESHTDKIRKLKNIGEE